MCKDFETYVDSIQHATLQNRAAIDFLLLAHGHDCQDFDSMCCMNLSDHSKSIHTHLADLQALSKQLQVENSWNPFGILRWGWPWLQKLLLFGLLLLLIFCHIVCCIHLLLSCIQRMITQLIFPLEVRMVCLGDDLCMDHMVACVR